MVNAIITMFCSQYLRLPYPDVNKFTGRTIIVTGSNIGLGLATARHFVRLDAAKVILAVRSLGKGEAAAQDVNATERRPGVVEVWKLDLASYASVKEFAKRASQLERLDVLVENAAVFHWDFSMAEEDETTITVNVVNTMLLGLLLLPKLRETSKEHNTKAVLAFVGSFVHRLTDFPERLNPDIWESLRDSKTARMDDRYNVSKLMQLLLVRELATELAKSEKGGYVITSVINPGWVATSLLRDTTSVAFKLWLSFGNRAIARTTDVGARTVLHAACGDEETHGQYLSDCKVEDPSKFVRSEVGRDVQKKLWRDLSAKLERVSPGVMENI